MAFTKADKVLFRASALPFGTTWIPGIKGYRAAQNPLVKAAALLAYDREIQETTWALADDMGFADDLKALYEDERLAILDDLDALDADPTVAPAEGP